MRTLRWLAGFGAAWAGLLLAAVPAPAQKIQTVGDATGAAGGMEVEVPVQVVRDGQPVRGLTRDDFAVYDGGTGQTLTGFQAVAGRRQLLLLFDLVFSDPQSVVKARDAARELVTRGLRPDDLVGVATYSAARGPQLILAPTPDRRQVESALSSLGAGRPVRADDPLRLVLGHARGVLPGGADSHRLAERSQEADAAPAGPLPGKPEAQKAAATALTRSLSDFARTLGALPGRKQVVYFSAGFDGTPLDAFEGMLEELRRASCAVQAVDLGGPGAGGRESLLALAHGTGGELFAGAGDLAPAMSGVLERASLTYVLSFRAEPVKPDGAYHKLRVELKKAPPGTSVVFRPGWYAPRPYSQRKPLEKLLEASSKLMGGGADSGAIASAVLAAPFRAAGAAGDRAYVPVLIEVDGPALLVARPGGVLPVEVYVYALGADGAIQGFLFQTLGLDLAKTEATLRQSGLKFFGHLDLPAGEYSVRTLIRNGATGAYSLRVAAPLTVPAFAAGPVLLPPLFPEPANRWLVLREAQRGEPVPDPFMLRQQPFIPASRPALAAGQETPVALMGYNLAAGDLKAEARVLTPDGRESGSGDLRVLSRESGGGGPDRLTATFKPPRLPPGEYLLRVTLAGAAGPAATSSAPFVVGR
ncbi:MAG TPA: VWA domain-containing protein [Thermoanaerobaculia bacterium]|jgi:VWFA-related protein|nr:VWA domain-containing protein [Thermoanaerobaculia bacterium]